MSARLAALSLLIGGCASSAPQSEPSPVALPGGVLSNADDLDDLSRAPQSGGFAAAPAAKASAELRETRNEPPPPPAEEGEASPEAPGAKGEAEAPERTRSWFPEAFLWRPEVVTGADGRATVDVTVPDQLTTWRVLGLAHDAAGHQAGTVHTFDGTLPLYVDPVVPGWLYAGDHLVLPVQAVNTTADPIAASLEVEARGALSGLGRAAIALGAVGSDVRTIPLDAVGAGEAQITARLLAAIGSDAAERSVPVAPSGRPVEGVRGGTLAAERTFRLAPPEGADPTTELLEIRVFPGPLAVLQLELERLAGGARPEDGAYGFAIDSSIATLSAATGVEVDEAVLRRLRILAWQRVVYDARAPDPGLAADLLGSIRGETRHPQVQELIPRLVQTVVNGQRPDGTWSRRPSSTIQAVLVETATAVHALPETEPGARLRASAAVERYIREVKDPYTAAVILASDLARGGLEDGLRKIVTEALVTDEETGEPRVVVPAGVVNAWGVRPTRTEMLAWTVLALPTDVLRGDLAAQLMQGWSATRGFGAGRADAVALQAITSAFGGVSGPVDVSLAIDGVVVASGKLDPAQPMLPVMLGAKPGGADPSITLTTTPPVPGLAFVATRRSWVPWTDADRVAGVEVEVAVPTLKLGTEGEITLTAAAPSGVSLRIEQGLPSGADVGAGAREQAAALGATLQILTDRVVIVTRPFQAGEVLTLALPITPAFAGRFQTGPLLLSVDGAAPVPMRPAVWSVAGATGGS